MRRFSSGTINLFDLRRISSSGCGTWDRGRPCALRGGNPLLLFCQSGFAPSIIAVSTLRPWRRLRLINILYFLVGLLDSKTFETGKSKISRILLLLCCISLLVRIAQHTYYWDLFKYPEYSYIIIPGKKVVFVLSLGTYIAVDYWG